MRGLIIGGYGYLGSELVKKCVQEGIDITVVDDVSDDEYFMTPKVKHKYYKTFYGDKTIKNYIRDNKFEFAVLAVEPYRLLKSSNEINKLISNLQELMTCLVESKVKKIIILSSLDLSNKKLDVINKNKILFYSMIEDMCKNLNLEYVNSFV